MELSRRLVFGAKIAFPVCVSLLALLLTLDAAEFRHHSFAPHNLVFLETVTFLIAATVVAWRFLGAR